MHFKKFLSIHILLESQFVFVSYFISCNEIASVKGLLQFWACSRSLENAPFLLHFLFACRSLPLLIRSLIWGEFGILVHLLWIKANWHSKLLMSFQTIRLLLCVYCCLIVGWEESRFTQFALPPPATIFWFCFCVTPGGTQNLPLAQCSGITYGKAQETGIRSGLVICKV